MAFLNLRDIVMAYMDVIITLFADCLWWNARDHTYVFVDEKALC